jgi:hypothetical protein
MTDSPKMLTEKKGPLGWKIFDQPEKRNADSQEMWHMGLEAEAGTLSQTCASSLVTPDGALLKNDLTIGTTNG